jgi:hypothetical protein
LLARLKLFDGKVIVTFGPQFQIWNEAGLGPTGVGPANANGQPIAAGQPNPATAPTGGTGTGTLGTLNNAIPFPVTTRDEFYLQAPGDVSFKLFNIPVSLYWDTSYNVWGPERFNEVYGPLFSKVTYKKNSSTPIFSDPAHASFQDYFAWMVGFKIGQNNHAGDMSLLVDYRQLGLASVDPNINTNDFNLSYLNAVGWRASFAVNITDFAVFAVTGWFANNLDRNLFGGYATTPSLYPLANANSSQVIAVDLSFKF